jgi:hypothetical protein
MRDGLAISAPAFWEEEKDPNAGYVLRDPLTDTATEITTSPVRNLADPERALEAFAEAERLKAATAEPHARGLIGRATRFELGGRVFFNIRYNVRVQTPQEHATIDATSDVYLTIIASSASAKLCRIEFQTLTVDYDQFRPLIRRIVGSIRSMGVGTLVRIEKADAELAAQALDELFPVMVAFLRQDAAADFRLDLEQCLRVGGDGAVDLEDVEAAGAFQRD